jgi:hypothetical protein
MDNDGMLPVTSRIALAMSRIAYWPMSIEYRLHMAELEHGARAAGKNEGASYMA